MGDAESTLRPIGTVLSLVCQQYRVVVPNCTCRSVRSAGGEYRTFTKCTVRGSLYPVETDSSRKFQYWYTCTAVPVERYSCIHRTGTGIQYIEVHIWQVRHLAQLIHFSSLPCTTIHQSKALGLINRKRSV